MTPQPLLRDYVNLPPAKSIYINGENFQLSPLCTVNGIPAELTAILKDSDEVICREQPGRRNSAQCRL